MRIGIVSNVHGCSWAGSEEVWKLAADLALEKGHEITAFLHPDIAGSPVLNDLRKNGAKIREWKPFVVARLQKLKERFQPEFPASIFDSLDVLLVSLGSLPAMTYVPGLVPGLLRTSTPVVILCHFNADHLFLSPAERQIVRTVLEKCSKLLFVAKANLETARRQLALSLNKAVVLDNPIRNGGGRAALPWPEGGGAVCFASVARLETYWKGQDILLEVLSKPQWKVRDWVLRLYGSGPDLPYLEQLISFYNLEGKVFLPGYERDLESLWKQHHLLILSSHGEGSPLVLLEAMNLGRPALVTKVGGMTELVVDGVTGFHVEAATVSCLEAAMERAWSAREAWKGMGEAALERVRSSKSCSASGMLLELLLE